VAAAAPGTAEITGTTAAVVGDLAASLGIPVHELTPRTGSLEDAYLALTGESVEYKTKEIA
jgi:ABC-2 type transport system ATP-binding protein